jgi:DNA repair photolyase
MACLTVGGYSSPRWTGEILDCSMPMTFDTYSQCAFRCLYCFAYSQQKCKAYFKNNLRSVNPIKIVNLFNSILKGKFGELSQTERQFIPYVSSRKIMQWGALADEFDWNEHQHNITLQLLKFFDIIDYPLSFSTKGAWWTKDKRYMDIFARHSHNWHVKISIITPDKMKARKIEGGVETPKERMEALRRLGDIGINTTLRLRPYIIGASDEYEQLISMAHQANVKSVTTEFFCMDSRGNEKVKKLYKELSEILGFDIYEFYCENSSQNGYLRLNRNVKFPIIEKMQRYTKSLGMRFNVSDTHCREFNEATNCCGVPPEWNYSKAHFGGAILIAKQKGFVQFKDIRPDIEKLFGSFNWLRAAGFNTISNGKAALFRNTTMAQWIRYKWNNLSSQTSPAKAYGCLIPVGNDENGDVIYQYSGGKF